MQLPHFLLLAGALGAAAHPSGHAHLHRSAAKRDGETLHVKNVHSVPPPPPPATTSKAAAAPSATPAVKAAASDSSSDSTQYIPFCGGTSSKSKRVTDAQVKYAGNQGTSGGCKWNSNMMVVPNSIADKYQYVQKYTNAASEPYQVICANKIGQDGQPATGLFVVKGQTPLIFTLQPGETKTVAADKNTQGACAFAPNAVPTTKNGQYAGTWAEFDFGSDPNGGWSGGDCSSLVAEDANMDVPGCKMSHGGVDSTIFPGGKGVNAFIKGTALLDGLGLNIPPADNVVIEVKVGISS